MHDEHLRVTEVNSVKPDKDNSSPASALMGFGAIIGRGGSFPVLSVSGSDTSDDKVGNGHANTTNDEDCLPAKSVDVQDGRDRGEEHDDANNSSCEERDGIVGTLTCTEANALEDERRLMSRVSSCSTSLL
jgi:hypothetical protein